MYVKIKLMGKCNDILIGILIAFAGLISYDGGKKIKTSIGNYINIYNKTDPEYYQHRYQSYTFNETKEIRDAKRNLEQEYKNNCSKMAGYFNERGYLDFYRWGYNKLKRIDEMDSKKQQLREYGLTYIKRLHEIDNKKDDDIMTLDA